MHRHTSAWQVKRPLFVGGLTAVAVTAMALKAPLAAVLACVVPLVLLLCWKRVWLCAVVAVCCLLVTVGYRHVYIRPAMALDGEIDTLTGRVVAYPTTGEMHTLQVISSDCLPSGSRVMMLLPDEPSVALYDVVTVRTELVAIKDNQNYYAAHGAFVCGFAVDESAEVTRGNVPTGVMERCRNAVARVVYAALPARESGILAALCFGQRDGVFPEVAAAFRGSGLSHLLVVSGLHLSMVALAVRRLFRRFGMVGCCLLTLCAVWLFALFVGLTPSVLRAAVMVSVWMVGCLLFCRSDGLNSLGLAAILLLVCRPYTLLDVGFQLSFAATMGVLVLAHRLSPYESSSEDTPWWQRVWNTCRITLKNAVVVCVSALLFSLPIACYHYGGMPLLSLLSNPLAAPAAGTAMLFGWLGAVIGLVPFLGWLSQGCLLLAGLLARYMAWLARLCSPSWGWLSITRPWQWLLLCVGCAVAVCGIFCRATLRRVLTALLALVVLAAAVGVTCVDAPLQMIVVPVDNEGGFLLRQGSHCALIVTDLREINEVVYDTYAFTPEVLYVMNGDVSAVSQATRWSDAAVVAAAPAEWAGGSRIPLSLCEVGETVALWSGCSLTRLSDGWTLLMLGEEAVCIGTDPDLPCPYPDGWQIYVGCAPTSPTDAYTVVCNASWLRRHRSALAGQATVLYDDIVTFTPLRGEWRALPWL